MRPEPPLVQFDVDRGSDAGQRLVDTVGLASQDIVTWGSVEGEAPDDVRSAIHDALRAEFGGWIDGWQLLPRVLSHEDDTVAVVLVPIEAVQERAAEDAHPEVQKGPRARLLDTLDEQYHDHGVNRVPKSLLLEETQGDPDTLEEELRVLIRSGEVYEVNGEGYSRTNWPSKPSGAE